MYYSKRPSLNFLSVLVIILAVGCTNSSIPEISIEGQWEFVGGDTLTINKLQLFNGSLYLATEQGIWRETESGFSPLGLLNENVISIVKTDEQNFIAGIRSSGFSSGDDTIFKTTDNGETWTPFMGNFGGENGRFTWIEAMVRHPDNPDTLYARGGVNVSRTTDGGQTWESVFNEWEKFGSTAPMLKIDPNRPATIWAGGANAIFQPNLFRSTDDGNNWVRLDENIQIFDVKFEATVYDIVIDPRESSHVLLGLSLGIFRSTDLGESWESVFDRESSIFTLTNSIRSESAVYASGQHPSEQVFFMVTSDFGDSWEVITFDNEPGDIIVTDMLSVEREGNEVLYLGTNKGLFSFTFAE